MHACGLFGKLFQLTPAPEADSVREMDELWCIHVLGPDEILAAPSKEDAEGRALKLGIISPHPFLPLNTLLAPCMTFAAPLRVLRGRLGMAVVMD